MLRLLGPARVSGAGTAHLPRTAFLAAALIDLAPGRLLSREVLAARLWDGASPSRAASNLRQLVSRIRAWEAATGLSAFAVTSTNLARTAANLPSDLALFLAMPEPRNAARLRLFAELYGGDFLADLPDPAETTRQWIVEQRSWLRERFVTHALAAARRVGGEIGEDVLRRLANEAPYDDNVARAGMIALRRDPQAVRALYDRFANRLRLDLRIAPEPATVALLRELLPGSAAPATPRAEPPPGTAAASASVPRVLILPPAGADLSPGDEALGAQLIDEVTHTLGRLRTFAVFAPHSARQLAAAAFPAGNPYGADYLVTTRFAPARDGGNRLCVALTRVATHELLLSEELRFATATLNLHHHDLAAALGMRLAQGIERSELHFYVTTGSSSAYVAYLLGCEALRGVDLRSLRRARRHFRQALQLSPDFAAARSLLARAMSLEWVLLDRSEREPIRRAITLAREAARLDPMDPNAHLEIGHALLYLGEFDEGVASLRTATGFGPHRADVLHQYGDGLIHLGEMHEARRVMDQALSLNPLAPDLWHWVRATADYFLGDFDEAAARLGRMRDPEPAARVIAAVEAMRGNLDEAGRYRDIYLAAHPGFRLAEYMIPQRRRQDRELYLEGLRRAGFH